MTATDPSSPDYIPPPTKPITAAQWFDIGTYRPRDPDDVDLDVGGRLADAEAARVYGGRDVD